MRKKKIIGVCLSMVISLIVFVSPIRAKTIVNIKDNEKSFERLQNQITESMTVARNKYVYDEKEIKTLIYNSDVDFSALNKKYNTSYTKESFFKLAIANIKKVNLSTKEFISQDTACKLRSRHCGETYTTGGWNYKRYFCDNSATKKWVQQLQGVINAAMVGSIASDFVPVPGVDAALNVGFTVSGFYNEGLKDAPNSNNDSCGAVTDINKFIAAYTVVSQDKF